MLSNVLYFSKEYGNLRQAFIATFFAFGEDVVPPRIFWSAKRRIFSRFSANLWFHLRQKIAPSNNYCVCPGPHNVTAKKPNLSLSEEKRRIKAQLSDPINCPILRK